MNWINFLHIYQPPTQTKDVFDNIVRESYSLILKLLKEYPRLVLTMNISGSLLELLEKHGHNEIILGFAKYATEGRIELVGSAMYHPILPLIQGAEVRKQIELHNEISKKFFGEAYNPKGFYIPEMAYSNNTARIIKELGFEWIILDPISTTTTNILSTIKYEADQVNLKVIFRNTEISKTFPIEHVLEHSTVLANEYLVTAHDGELYGHWHKDDRGYYKKAFSNPDITFITASDYLNKLDKTEKVTLRDSNWESTPEELSKHVSFALWNNPKNSIHKKLWDLAHLAEKTLVENSNDPYIGAAQDRLHRGLASCAWWWASEHQIGPFSPVCWNPKEIEEGGHEIIEAIRTLKNISSNKRIEAESAYTDLHELIWENHWLKHNTKVDE